MTRGGSEGLTSPGAHICFWATIETFLSKQSNPVCFQMVIQMYSRFFPVFKDKGKEVEILRPIEDYVLPKIEANSNSIASLLAYLIDFNFLYERNGELYEMDYSIMSNVTSSLLFHLSAKHLGMSKDSQDHVNQIYKIINSFSYEPLQEPFFQYDVNADNRYKLFCEDERTAYETGSSDRFSIHSLCSSESTSKNGTVLLSHDCQWYCQAIVNNKKTQELIRSFYALAEDLKGPLVPGNPETLLPLCRFPGEGKSLKDGCWERIVTDKGICFSSVTGLK